jgi:hypothetical protein
MLEDGTARLLRMNGDRISEAASFPTKPWFLDTARVGDLIVRMAGNDLEIDRFGASAVL